MTSRPLLVALALGASLAAMPALAATAPNQPNSSSPNHSEQAVAKDSNHSGANNGAWKTAASDKTPDKLNPLLTSKGLVQMKKLIGSDVYNDQDKKLGSIDDVLVDKHGQPTVLVRVNSKLHEVPWSKLRFGDAEKSDHNKVLMPDESKDALNATPQFQDKGKDTGKKKSSG
ncbi:MAG TPA: PRC-barrel domain-containing protein [Acetobacteraceae bacterium]|nr:PRC-barrel domain-containing protein [Acetobacteraceae bacterium]